MPELDAHAIAAFKRFYKLLPKGDDPALMILKIHLLIEEQIRAYIDERINSPMALEAARLDCHQAICLAEALCGENIQARTWVALRKLNTLRNDVAHNL